MGSVVVIASARRRTLQLLVLGVIFFMLLGGFYVVSLLNKAPSFESRAASLLDGKKIGQIGSGHFNFEIAKNPIERAQGLSGRESLPATDALLFVFDSPGKHCIWMKDMKFNIDILWFDINKKLIYEKRDVSPDTYPKNFCPDTLAKYVVELTAGAAAKNQIKIGDSLDIEL